MFSDNGGEFKSSEFEEKCENFNIKDKRRCKGASHNSVLTVQTVLVLLYKDEYNFVSTDGWADIITKLYETVQRTI